jgi:hypothetical protein
VKLVDDDPHGFLGGFLREYRRDVGLTVNLAEALVGLAEGSL